jgi:hypothetical protein
MMKWSLKFLKTLASDSTNRLSKFCINLAQWRKTKIEQVIFLKIMKQKCKTKLHNNGNNNFKKNKNLYNNQFKLKATSVQTYLV